MADQSSTRRSSSGDTSGPGVGPAESEGAIGADHLTYMADMIAELQEIARRGRFDALATILGLAEVEASRLAMHMSPSARR